MKVRLEKKKATKVLRNENYGGEIGVRLYTTDIVIIRPNVIILDTGGYNTATTIRRMNEVSEEFGLGYRVYRKDGGVMVLYKGMDFHFENDYHINLAR